MSFLDLISLYTQKYAINHSIALLPMYFIDYFYWTYTDGLGTQTVSKYRHKTDIKACHTIWVCVTGCLTQVYEYVINYWGIDGSQQPE